MDLSVDLGVVVATATAALTVALIMTLLSRGHGRDRPSDVMAASCLCFALSAMSFAAGAHLPFMLAATLVIAGALGGMLLAYLAIHLALGGQQLSWKLPVGFFGAAVLGQAGLAAWAGDVVPLMFSSSVINSLAGGVIAVLLW
ncbi:MAG: hypothetical protein AAFN05_13340, partial [Pseudomonadota bacterium]